MTGGRSETSAAWLSLSPPFWARARPAEPGPPPVARGLRARVVSSRSAGGRASAASAPPGTTGIAVIATAPTSTPTMPRTCAG
eukprot:8785649-Alexandrium_andersonii.AAC.1